MKNSIQNSIRSSAMFLVVLLLSLTPMVLGEIVPLPLSSSFDTPISSACHGKTLFLHDENTHECMLHDNIPRVPSTSKNFVGESWKVIPRGGFSISSIIPAGYNPFGYCITELGQKFLEFDGSLDSDVGRLLASVKSRKRFDTIKSQWLEIIKVSKKGQSMRIYRQLEDLINFCLKAGFLD